MQIRFLAFIANGSSDKMNAVDQAIVSKLGLGTVLSTPKLLVLATCEPHLLTPNGAGIILGHVYTRSASPRPAATRDLDLDKLVKTQGRSLISEVWGGYIAFACLDDKIIVIRDPSGAMPCMVMATDDGFALASDVDMLVAFGLLRPQVDWLAMLDHLVAYDFRTTATCLEGVTEIPAGHRFTSPCSKFRTEAIWSPWDYVNAGEDRDYLCQTGTLRDIVTTSVCCWASSFGHILLGVSGGLDSSILAAILKDEATPLTCYTMVTDEAEGDERTFSRALSASLNIDISEHFYHLEDIDITRATAAHLPRPLRSAFGQSDHQAKLSIASAIGIDAFFTGIGGDNVFCNMTSARPVVDRLLKRGLSGGVLQTLNDVCELAGCSYWQAIEKSAKALLPDKRQIPWLRDFRFLRPDVLDARLPQHPWLDVPQSALPGKWSHIAMLARIHGTLDGFSRAGTPPLVNPLLSQPVVEACLAIPTWQWFAGGHNRAPIRCAFADVLPESIIRRRSKGGPGGFAYGVIQRNRRHLLDILMNGAAAKAGLLDLPLIEHELRSDAPIQELDYPRFGLLAEMEAWTAHWTSQSPASANPSKQPIDLG